MVKKVIGYVLGVIGILFLNLFIGYMIDGNWIRVIVFGLAMVGSFNIALKLIEEPNNKKNYKEMKLPYPNNWNEIRQQTLIRDNYSCGNCASSNNLHVHHIVPISRGGSNNLNNLRTLCEDCHKKIHPHMRD